MTYTLTLSLQRLFPAAVLAAFGLAVLLAPASALAAGVDVLETSCGQGGGSSQVCDSSGQLFGSGSLWENIVNTLIFIIGAVAVIMVVVGGLRYVLAGGDESATKSAKNTIIYAVVGLVLAIAAGGIVNFVLDSIA